MRDRLTVYHRNTAPLVEFYREAGLVRRIDGDQGIEEVTKAVLAAAGVSSA